MAAFVDALPLPLEHSADPVPFHMALHAIVSAASAGHDFGVASAKSAAVAAPAHIVSTHVIEDSGEAAEAAAEEEAAAASLPVQIELVAEPDAPDAAAAAPAPASSEASRGEEARAE